VAGKAPALLGFSSGAMLVVEGAQRGLAASRLILVEPPYVLDASRPRPAADFPDRLRALIAEGRRGEAVELFQTDFIGMPREIVEQSRNAPFRPALEAMAQSTVYDATIASTLTLDRERAGMIRQPVLSISGSD